MAFPPTCSPAFCIPPPPCVPSIYLPSYPIPPCTPAPICYPPPPTPAPQVLIYTPPPQNPCCPPPACCKSNCAPPCAPVSSCCKPCTPSPCCNPCQSSCRPQSACCGARSSCCCPSTPKPIVCLPIRLQAQAFCNYGNSSQGQRAGSAKRPPSQNHQKAIQDGNGQASYNNCNFYVSNLPGALMGNHSEDNTECTEESSEHTENTDECTSTGFEDEDEWCDEEEEYAPVVQRGRGQAGRGYRGRGGAQRGGYAQGGGAHAQEPNSQCQPPQGCCFPPPGCCFPFPCMIPMCPPGLGMFGGGMGGGAGAGSGGRGRAGGDPYGSSGYGRGRGGGDPYRSGRFGRGRGGGDPCASYGRGRGQPGYYRGGGAGSNGSGSQRTGPYGRSPYGENGGGPYGGPGGPNYSQSYQPSNYPISRAPTAKTVNTKAGPSKSCLTSKATLKRGASARTLAKSSGYRPYSYSQAELTQKSTAYLPDQYDSNATNVRSMTTTRTRSAGVGPSAVPSYAPGSHVPSSYAHTSYGGAGGGRSLTATKAYSEPNLGSRRGLNDDEEGTLVPVYRTSTQTRLQIVERPNEPSEIRVIQRPVQEVVSYQRIPEPQVQNSRINLDVVTDDMTNANQPEEEECEPKKNKCRDPCKRRRQCPRYHTRRLHRLCSFTNRRKRRLSQIHKPMICFKAPPCPIRETMASILRKKPPACCMFHEQEVPAFHEYCMTDACPDTNRYPLLTRELSPLCHEYENQNHHNQHHNDSHDQHHHHGEEGAMAQQHKGHGKCVEKRGAKRKLHHR